MPSQPQARIDRINELAAKAKTGALTEAETAERKELRAAFLADFRAGMRDQIETTQFFDKKGNEITPKKIVKIQRERGQRED